MTIRVVSVDSQFGYRLYKTQHLASFGQYMNLRDLVLRSQE
jgi:hypothetical protein